MAARFIYIDMHAKENENMAREANYGVSLCERPRLQGVPLQQPSLSLSVNKGNALKVTALS